MAQAVLVSAFALVLFMFAWGMCRFWPLRRLWYTQNRRLRNEIADLTSQLEKTNRDRGSMFKTWVNWQLVDQAQAQSSAAQAKLAAGDKRAAKQAADEGLRLLFKGNRSLNLIGIRLSPDVGRECSLLEHYISGRYRP